jgi:hypothetical protein
VEQEYLDKVIMVAIHQQELLVLEAVVLAQLVEIQLLI